MGGLVRQLDSATFQPLLRELGEEARAHRFAVAPNPCVGAAVITAGRVIARGFHRQWGGPHAEVEALAAAARTSVPRHQWDTLVVTLEPCSTEGKTPACTEALARSGVRTVVVGSLDPDARHRGRGVEILRERGLEVVVLEGASPLETVAPHFLSWTGFDSVRRPRPWTIAKWAQTLTGQLVPPEDVGGGRWITGPEARADVQLLRARVDAIVSGVGTVLADDPRFSVRAPGATDSPPARVVLDGYLRTPPDCRLLAPPVAGAGAGAGEGGGEVAGPVHLLCQRGSDANRQRHLVEAGAELSAIRGDDRLSLNLRAVQTWLWDQGFRRVLLEAGPTLLASYLEAGFVDQIKVYTGDVRGGRGTSLAPWLTGARLKQRQQSECGADSVLEAFLTD